MKKSLLIRILAIFIPFSSFAQLDVRHLHYLPHSEKKLENWEFSKSGTNEWKKATIPGTIHTDLWDNAQIPDPYFRDNEKKLQWVGENNWEYRTTFQIDKKEKDYAHCVLNFEGLDTYCDVFLNGKKLFYGQNMFRSYKNEIQSELKIGTNELSIIFYSPFDTTHITTQKQPYTLPESPRIFARKAQFQYGWDWGPKYISAGIWKSCSLFFWNNLKQEDLFIRQDSIIFTTKDTTAFLTACVEINADTSQNLVLSVMLEMEEKKQILKQIFPVKQGKHLYLFPFQLKNPQLWWTKELGEPFLYPIHCTLMLADSEKIIANTLQNVGIREIKLRQIPDNKGQSFYFELNHQPLFIKGANYIPMESFSAPTLLEGNRHSYQHYNTLIQAAQDANFNMLRVWGGGIYEDDLFYALCDRAGILVWQDFMFACAMYPGDSIFLDNVENEVIDNVKRLRQHPSIALWCGNNEIAEAWFNWGWQKQYRYSKADSLKIWGDYQHLFHQLIPKILAQYDGTRPYHPSSPANGWGREKAYTEGDVHYWGVWWGRKDYRSYQEKVGRFVSEYGMQAFPDWETVLQFTEKEDRKWGSDVLKAHQKHPTGYENLDFYLKKDFLKKGHHIRSLGLNEEEKLFRYAYLTQLLQSEAIGTAIDAHRGNMPYCMGTLYWQLNDCWPVVSWSSVDYYGKWKALHYRVREAYKPISIVLNEKDNQQKISIVSDLLKEKTAVLKWEIWDFDGHKISEESQTVTIAAQKVSTFSDILLKMKELNPKTHFVFISLKDAKTQQIIAEKYHYFTHFKSLQLPKTQYNIQILELTDDEENELIIEAKNFLKNISIYIPHLSESLKENYFDMKPGDVKHILIPKGVKKEAIKILTYNDL